MARKLCIVMFCLVAMLLLLESHAETIVSTVEDTTTPPTDGTSEGSLQPEECGTHCDYRCSKTHHKKPCLFFCNKCCAKCLCVPPGTYGNKEVCPCYNNWKTKRGGPKCP